MKFVKNNQPHTGELRIALQSFDQQAFRQHFNARLIADPALHAHLVTYRLAYAFTE